MKFLVEVILAATMLRQEGTGDMIPRADPIPNRPQYQHPGGPVRPHNMPPPMSWSDPFKACISVECRLFCKPDNQMRPDWCNFYNAPRDGYIELEPQIVE